MSASHRRWFRLAPIVFVLAWALVHEMRRPEASARAGGARVRVAVDHGRR